MFNKFYGSFFKITLLNLSFFSFLIYFLNKGWLQNIFIQDISYISVFISFISILTVIYLNIFSFKINLLQNKILTNNIENFEKLAFGKKIYLENQNKNSENLFFILNSKIYFSNQISLIVTLLGLLGTVLGFIYVLLFIDFSLLKDIENLQKVLTSIATGMGIALYTTLVGTICSIWIYIEYIILYFDIKKLCFLYFLIKKE